MKFDRFHLLLVVLLLIAIFFVFFRKNQDSGYGGRLTEKVMDELNFKDQALRAKVRAAKDKTEMFDRDIHRTTKALEVMLRDSTVAVDSVVRIYDTLINLYALQARQFKFAIDTQDLLVENQDKKIEILELRNSELKKVSRRGVIRTAVISAGAAVVACFAYFSLK